MKDVIKAPIITEKSASISADGSKIVLKVAKDAKHPYNTTGDLGWMNESDISLYDDKSKYEVEIEIIDKDDLMNYILEHDDKIVMIDSKALKDILEDESKSNTL